MRARRALGLVTALYAAAQLAPEVSRNIAPANAGAAQEAACAARSQGINKFGNHNEMIGT